MLYKTTFRVRGNPHVFPFDMLRYDCCFPDHQEDSSLFHAMVTGRVEQTGTVPFEIGLCRFHDGKDPHLSDERWRSFGWMIVKETIHTQRL